MKPILQVALDFVDLPRALKVAKEAVEGGIDWLEAGTPLIKSVGLDALRELRKNFPHHTLVADLKTMDAGRIEVEMAAKAGANIVVIMGAAPISTIKESVLAANNYGARIMIDLLGTANPLKRAKEVEELGADFLCIHIAIDEQMEGKISLEPLRRLVREVRLPIAIAGGMNSELSPMAIDAGASIIIVGGAITKAEDARKATEVIREAIIKKKSIKTELFHRVGKEDLLKILNKVSTANISDALHREGELKCIMPIITSSEMKMVGKALTVRTYPGDWAKPVEAVDIAREGDVIVIDAGGVGPAVWGELATNSAVVKKLSGVVIDGAIRDTREIREINFPSFAKIITPSAGEPKGLGEIGVPITVGGRRVFPGDWLIGDMDGVVVIPEKRAIEITNRAMDVLEKENRIRKEIKDGGTLSQITELLKWEKK